MIKLIAFDIGGVLTKIGNTKRFIEELAKISGKDYFTCREIFYSNELGEYNDEKISLSEFLNIITKKLSIRNKITDEELLALYRKCHLIIPQIIEILKKLKRNGYKIAYFTDRSKLSLDLLMSDLIEKYFDTGIASFEFGITKPNPYIYDKFLERVERLGIRAEEIVFIDDKDENLVPAKEKNIKTILFINYEDLILNLKKLGIDL